MSTICIGSAAFSIKSPGTVWINGWAPREGSRVHSDEYGMGTVLAEWVECHECGDADALIRFDCDGSERIACTFSVR